VDELKQNIEKIVADCFKEIADHSLQSEVRSKHIMVINDNLKKILNCLESSPNHRTICKVHDRERVNVGGDIRNAAIKIAYAMSRFDYQIINDILKTHLNQTEAFEYAAGQLSIKMTTLRNYRDRFDPYVKQENSNRKGWWQVELPEEFQAIKDDFDAMNYSEIKNVIGTILLRQT